MRSPIQFTLIAIGALSVACASVPAPPAPAIDLPAGRAVLYALGDWGTGDDQQLAVGYALSREVAELEASSTAPLTAPAILGLGDNVYEYGLPVTDDPNDPRILHVLHRTLIAPYANVRYADRPVTLHAVSGNHDHARAFGTTDGWGDLVHQEVTAERVVPHYRFHPLPHAAFGFVDSNDRAEFDALATRRHDIERLLVPDRVRHPHDATGMGLVDIVAIDTQSILTLLERGDEAGVRAHFDRLETLLNESAAPWKLVIGHHPVQTRGWHGGLAGWRQWLWSGARNLLDEVPWPLRPLTIPVAPVLVGLDQWVYRNIQDTDHPVYPRFQEALSSAFRDGGVDVYLAGHDHNLQYIDAGAFAQVVSGSAGKLDPVRDPGGALLFSAAEPGYVRVDATRAALSIAFQVVERVNGVPTARTAWRAAIPATR